MFSRASRLYALPSAEAPQLFACFPHLCYGQVSLPHCPFTRLSYCRMVLLPHCPIAGWSYCHSTLLPDDIIYHIALVPDFPISIHGPIAGWSYRYYYTVLLLLPHGPIAITTRSYRYYHTVLSLLPHGPIAITTRSYRYYYTVLSLLLHGPIAITTWSYCWLVLLPHGPIIRLSYSPHHF